MTLRSDHGPQFTGTLRDDSARKLVELQLQRERDIAQVTLASIAGGVIPDPERYKYVHDY